MDCQNCQSLAQRVAELEGSFRCYFCDRYFTAEAAVQHFRGHEYKLAVTEEHVKQLERTVQALRAILRRVAKCVNMGQLEEFDGELAADVKATLDAERTP